VKVSYSLTLPPEVESVPTARSLCRANLAMLGVSEASIDDVVLALSEACSNVVRHAGPAAYRVAVTITEDLCQIDVIDNGPGIDTARIDTAGIDTAGIDTAGRDASIPVQGSPEGLLTGGRGVALIKTLVDRLDFTLHMDRGTVVSFEKRLALLPGSPLRELSLGDRDSPA
jgi:serine/threonine-protein kinase RsbW